MTDTATELRALDDPSPTYRGYRRQAIYCLHRLFSDTLPRGGQIRPEGNEDLQIFDAGGRQIEVVQVKDYSADLAVSHFKPSFFERISPYCSEASKTTVTIASFGPLGRDLRETKNCDVDARHRVANSIERRGVKKQDAQAIARHLKIETVEEQFLANAIIGTLEKTVTGADASTAFEFLTWWLVTSAEKKLLISVASARSKVDDIGRFIQKRAAHSDEWHTTIVPLRRSPNGQEVSALADEFYRGVRARFEHITADLDVTRDVSDAAQPK